MGGKVVLRSRCRSQNPNAKRRRIETTSKVGTSDVSPYVHQPRGNIASEEERRYDIQGVAHPSSAIPLSVKLKQNRHNPAVTINPPTQSIRLSSSTLRKDGSSFGITMRPMTIGITARPPSR
jgi:hypothetical protein